MMGRRFVLGVVILGHVVPLAAAQPSASESAETVVEVRIQGNITVPDAQVMAAAGIAVGDPVTPDVLAAVEQRLTETGRFETVDVRKRYRSLTETDAVSIVVVVRERPGAASDNPLRRSVAQMITRRAMFLPLLRHDEGYGLTYGARTTFVEAFGESGRLSVPATWGGERRIALEADTRVDGPIVDRLRGGAATGRRRHPTFQVDDERTTSWAAVDRQLPGAMRFSAEAAWEDVTFGAMGDTHARYGLRWTYGALGEAAFPRDQITADVGIDWLAGLGTRAVVTRPMVDVRGYKGVGGQAVLTARVRFIGASAGLPLYEQALLGGGTSVRGWGVGDAVGDRLALASLELRLPTTSPLSFGNAGIRLFYDTGTAYRVGESIHDQRFLQGAGAGVFLSVPFFRLGLDVGHNLRGSARLHVGLGLSF